MNPQTTAKDLHWLFDDEAIAPPSVAQEALTITPDVGQADSEERREPLEPPEEPTEGEFREQIEGEVVVDPPKPKGIPVKWLVPIGAGALSIALTVIVVVLPIFQASATVIITPDKQTISMSATISTQGRQIFTQSLTLSQTVKTTGTAHQNATAGHGLVTFYNALQAPQTIPAGTLVIGADGIHVVTDADADIPAGTLATNGMISVPAHTILPGAATNITVGDINGPCCREYVFARNSQFRGGQDARDFKTASVSDIQTVTTELGDLLTQSLTRGAQKQITPGETLFPPQCQRKTTSDPKPGIEATRTTVTLTSTCTVYAYAKADVLRQEHTLLSQTLTSQLGSGYRLAGPMQEQISKTQTDGTRLHFAVTLTGNGIYHFTSAGLQTIKSLIIGKSQSQATALLLRVRGVQTVGIQIAHGRTTLPASTNNITISVFAR